MSDFDRPAGAPLLPPAPGMHAPPPSPFGVPQAPQFSGYAPPGYPLVRAATSTKAPRPLVKVGSVLLVVGGVGLLAGSLLNWVTVEGETFNGFAADPISLDGGSNGGPAFVFFAVLLVGFGIAQFVARKVLAIAILAVVFASFALLGSLAEMGDVSDVIKLADLFGVESSWGPGVPMLGLASVVGLGGAIATLSKRRR